MSCVSIRSVTVALCFALIFFTAAVSLGITFKFSLGAAQDIAARHAAALSSNARSSVEDFLSKPLGAVAGMQFLLRQNSHPLPNVTEPEDPEWFIWWWEQAAAMMRAADFRYQYAVVGFNDGNYAGCKLAPLGFQCRVFSMRTLQATGRNWLFQRDFNTSDHALLGEFTGDISYDPRTRVWFRMVEHKPMAMEWSDVYLSVSPTLPIVDVNGALFNRSGAFLGVLSVTFELGALSDFLALLETTPNTRGVLLDNNDFLLASSHPSPYLTQELVPVDASVAPLEEGCLRSDTANDATSSLILCRKSVSNYPWPALSAMQSRYPHFITHGTSGVERLSLDGTAFYTVVAPITTALSNGMRWRYLLLVPESDITAGIVRGCYVALAIVAGFLVGASLLTFFAIRVLLDPLDRLSHRMYKTASLQDDGDVEPPSRLHELLVIQTAYDAMKSELDKIKGYLPQSVMAALYGDAAEDSEADEGEIDDVLTEDGASSLGGSSRMSSRHASMILSQRAGNKRSSATERGGSLTQATPLPTTVSRKASNASMHSSVAGDKAPVALKTALRLVSRKVTVLVVNVCGFHAMTRNCPPEMVLKLHGELLHAINAAVHEHKGVVDSFSGDHVIATFNAVTTVGSHAPAAARAALAMRKAILQRRHHLKITGLTCGIATGQAMVGNVGTGNLRRFCVLGVVFPHAMALERLCKKYAQPSDGAVLLCGLAIAEVEQFFDLQFLDVIAVAGSTASETKRVRLAALKAEHAGAADEWMYVQESQASSSPFALHNDAFAKFCEGDTEAARVAIDKFVEQLSSVDPCPLDACEVSAAKHLQRLIAGGSDPRTYANSMSDYYARCLAGAPEGADSRGSVPSSG